MNALPGNYSLSAYTQDPSHSLGALVEHERGWAARYTRAAEALTKGQLVGPRVWADITTGITAAINTRTFTSSGSTFVKRVRRNDGTVTTWESPAIGSILHVKLGTGDQQFARVTDVLTTTKLGIRVLGRADGTWGTAVGSTATVSIIEPVAYLYDIDDAYGVPPFGYTLAETVAAGAFGFFGCRGIFECLPNCIVRGTPLMPSATAGQVEPAILYGSATWDAGPIVDGNDEAKDVTVTGAALGDIVTASLAIDVVDLALVATVTATNTVTAVLQNNSDGTIDLDSATLYVKVDKQITAAKNFDCGVLYSAPGTAAELGLVQCNLPSGVEGHWYF